MKIVTVIQARTSSTRLPNKVLLPLAGKPLLVRMTERVMRSKLAGTVVIATTTDSADDEIEALCHSNQLPVYRGDPQDCLDRHYQVGVLYQADAVVKIPSDCPLIDSAIIDKVIQHYVNHSGDYDFVSNLHPPTYPDGNDVEVMPMDQLQIAWKNALRPLEREHTTPFFWENPERFRLGNVEWETGQNYAMSHRWTIDYEADYRFISTIFDKLYAQNPAFGIDDILALLDNQPSIAEINAKYAGVNWYRNHLDELTTIHSTDTVQLKNE